MNGVGRREGVGPHHHRHAAEGRLVAERRRTRLPGCGSSRPRRCPPRRAASPSATAAAMPPEEPPLLRVEIERIARRTEQIIVAGAAQPHGRAVGLADEDRARRGLRSARRTCRSNRPEILHRPHAAEGRRPARLEIEQVLDGDGNAVQRPERLARHDGRLGGAAPRPGFVEGRVDEGVQAGVAAPRCARCASSMISTGETFRLRIRPAISAADRSRGPS